jgi:hypothetical protein
MGNVESNAGRNQAFALYFVVLAVGGGGLIAMGALAGWGYWAYFGGGLLVFAGAASLFSQARYGGAGTARCPSCGATFNVMHAKIARVSVCPGCHTWLHGAETMVPVPAGHVEPKGCPFEAPLPETFTWPEGCPVCGGAVTRRITVEGRSLGGTMAPLILPISVSKVVKVEAPACAEHGDGVGLSLVGGHAVVRFRAFDYHGRFCAQNQIAAKDVAAAYWQRSDTSRQVSAGMGKARG